MTQSPIQQQTIQLVATQIPKTEKLEEMLTPFALDETLIRHWFSVHYPSKQQHYEIFRVHF